jgi:hypothetical protein
MQAKIEVLGFPDASPRGLLLRVSRMIYDRTPCDDQIPCPPGKKKKSPQKRIPRIWYGLWEIFSRPACNVRINHFESIADAGGYFNVNNDNTIKKSDPRQMDAWCRLMFDVGPKYLSIQRSVEKASVRRLISYLNMFRHCVDWVLFSCIPQIRCIGRIDIVY